MCRTVTFSSSCPTIYFVADPPIIYDMHCKPPSYSEVEAMHRQSVIREVSKGHVLYFLRFPMNFHISSFVNDLIVMLW